MFGSRLFAKLYWAILGLTLMAVVATAALAYRWHDDSGLAVALMQTVVVVGIAVAGLGYLLVWRIVYRVRRLQRAAHAIADGDYDFRVPVQSSDEIGSLARSLNQLSLDLGRRMSQLRDSDERQAAILGGMIEGVIAVDDRQLVRFANVAAGKLLGFMPPSAVGRPLLEVVRNHTLAETVVEVLQSRKAEGLEIEWASDTPRTLAVQVTALPGAVDVGAVIVLRDNTELRRLETIRQEFIANVSHELKTPLSSIMAYTETLERGAIDDAENRGRFLRRIAEQGDRLNNLIQDMLRLARIETAQQPFEIVPVELAQVVRQCVADYAPPAEAKHIELVIASDLPAVRVRADEEGLRAICSNLIDNAVKYTQEGGRVQVAWTATNDTVRFEVVDNGPGIARSDASRVFERFYRVDKARSRELGSTGLGLSIVKHLVQSFGGTVGLESQVGQGSRFWVELPVA